MRGVLEPPASNSSSCCAQAYDEAKLVMRDIAKDVLVTSSTTLDEWGAALSAAASAADAAAMPEEGQAPDESAPFGGNAVAQLAEVKVRLGHT